MMKTNAPMFLVFTGIVLTMFGVGGVENSITDPEFFGSLAVSAVGLGIMYCGVLMLKDLDNQI